jgi:hypothetical protein
VSLNSFVIFLVSFQLYVKVAHYTYFSVLWVDVCILFL